MRHPRWTLGQFIGICFAALALLLAVLLSVFYEGSRRTILIASERVMAQASRRITDRVEGHLGEAERLVASLEAQVGLGVVRPAALPETIEPALVGALTEHRQVTEVTLTYGRAVGTYPEDADGHDAGDLRLAVDGRGQLSVARQGAAEASRLIVRRVSLRAGRWVAETRRFPFEDAATEQQASTDPTLHATFTVPSRAEHHGRALWSDLSYAEEDAGLAEPERRRVVSLQKALWGADGVFLGVLRVSLLSDRIDEFVKLEVDEGSSSPAEHVVFVCDRHGRLISRIGAGDRFALLDESGQLDPDGDVRVLPAAPPPQLSTALHSSMMHEVPAGEASIRRVGVDGTAYLVSIASLLEDRTQGWLVGIVVPESHYLKDLEASRRRVLGVASVVMLLSVLGAALVLRAIRGDLDRLIGETTRLRSFDFAPTKASVSTFRDVHEAAESLEQAKTALRALGKYVPLDLVRQLYEARVEPMLGGEIRDVTILFSDIEGFTSVSERLDPNLLAIALGAYLDAMTRAIHGAGGIIDKFTGDGVMALWNTPRPCAHHARRACEGALACRAAAEALFASSAWKGLAPWRTRFGIHRAEVSVGHFGAPDRMSFTAMGDGVNLAARLESLNKQYGTQILVSATVESEARDHFHFRRLDRVAVKGKDEGVEIFELVGRRSVGMPRPMVVERYERALDAYFACRFEQALAELRDHGEDAPSRVLAARCRAFLVDPPPAGWSGVFVAEQK